MKPVLTLAAACVFAGAALAADAVVRLGDATVRFDRASWQSSVSHDSISFAPQGEAARELDPVVLRVVAGEQPCAALAESAFLEPHWKAIAHNRLANLYVMQSYFQEAIAEYRVALQIAREAGLAEKWPTEHYLDNLGYCLILVGDYREGILHIHESLALARPRRNQRCITECFQDLSFAYMQLRSLRKAELYGRRALGMAVRKQYTDIVKTCYYLLGEIHFLQGNEKESDFYFGKLQEFYPGLDFLKDFLKTFDVSKILNFKNPS